MQGVAVEVQLGRRQLLGLLQETLRVQLQRRMEQSLDPLACHPLEMPTALLPCSPPVVWPPW